MSTGGISEMTRSMKQVLTRTPLGSVSFVRKRLNPLGYTFKRLLLRDLCLQHRCTDFIETGTYYGETARFMSRFVESVLTCEPYPPLYQYNVAKNAAFKNIKQWAQGSEQCFAEMARAADSRPLFWLDGHYSGAATAHTGTHCPLDHELDELEKLQAPLVIAIDDVRLFSTPQNVLAGTFEQGYPELDRVIARLRQLRPHNSLRIIGDCLVSTPEKKE